MIKIDDIEYRNLEEQVGKNQEDIKGLKFGLDIVGRVDSIDQIPAETEAGETYLVGTAAPYNICTKIDDTTLLDLGTLASTVIGPKGEKGDTGETGKGVSSAYLDGTTLHFTFTDGTDVLLSDIEGPRGLRGLKGDTGETGPKGDKGDQGERGETGVNFNIIAKLLSISQLPDPEDADANDAYLIQTATGYDMYIIVGKVWFNSGPMHLDDDAIAALTLRVATNEAAIEDKASLTGNNEFTGENNFRDGLKVSGHDVALWRDCETAFTKKTTTDALDTRVATNETAIAGKASLTGRNEFTGDNIFTGENDFTGVNNFRDGMLQVGGDEVALWYDCKEQFIDIATTTNALDTRVSLLETLIKPTYYFSESVDTFITRETGEGQNVIDNSDAKVLKIAGHSEVCSNLLNIPIGPESTYGAAAKMVDDTLILTSKGVVGYANAIYTCYDISEGEIYTVRYNVSSEYDSTLKVSQRDVNKNDISGTASTIPNGGTYTLTVNPACVYIRFAFILNNSSEIAPVGASATFSNIMFNKGDTSLPYEPYYEGIKNATPTKITSDTGFKKIEVGDVIDNFNMTKAQVYILKHKDYSTYVKFIDYTNDFRYQITLSKDYLNGFILYKLVNSTQQYISHIYYSFDKSFSYTFEYPVTCTSNTIPDYVQTNTGSSKEFPTDLTFPTSEFPIPAEIQALPGYGVEGNIVDFENKTYTQNNEIVDNVVTALSTPVVTDITKYIKQDSYKVWKHGTETFDSEVAPTLTSTYFVSRITEED